MQLSARECSCGARIVGDPISATPFKVKRFGPVMSAAGICVATLAASAAISLWIATGLIVVAWLSFRAFKLSRQTPELFGGRRVAAVLLILAIGGSLGLLGYATYRFPKYLENRDLRQTAQTQAMMYHIFGLLADYKNRTGTYPTNMDAVRKLAGGEIPADYWEQTLKYKSYTDAVGSVQRVEGASAASLGADDAGESGMLPSSQNFELRSAGPDGIMGTADDIVMLDGVFCKDPKILKEPISKDSPELK
ncbi:MAG TPA: hypothetical protein VEZ90_03490 [Blastocatellia bacterium]|nr:hypothetical protein [Blastocatellia bacterium]